VAVADTEGAARALAGLGRRVLLTVGSRGLEPFAAAPDASFVVRAVEPPAAVLDAARFEVILARGPFDLESECRLLRSRSIDVVVSKNSGGAAARAKLRKAELAEAMEAACAPRAETPGDVTPQARVAALAWTPPGFRAFDTGCSRGEEAPARAVAPEAGPDAAAEPTAARGAGGEEAAAPSDEGSANGTGVEFGAPGDAGSDGCDRDAPPAPGTACRPDHGIGHADGNGGGKSPAESLPVNGVETLRVSLDAGGVRASTPKSHGADALPAFLRGV